MKGSLRERQPVNWELIVQLPRDAETGLRKQLSRTHYGTKREAQRALAALVAQVSEGKITSTAKTLGQLLDSWIDHVSGSLSPTTVREYRRLSERLIKPDPLHPDTINGRFTRVRKQAGLDGVRLHDLRHLHATPLLAAGVPVRTVSGRHGHANAATTLNVYAHFLEASDRQAADVIADLLG